MDVREIQNKEEWNSAVKQLVTPSVFLQSWEWGEFQAAYGRPVFRFLVEDEAVPVLVMSCVVMNLPFGKTYLLAHRGPLASNTAAFEVLRNSQELREVCSRNQVAFLRVEPVGVEIEGAQKVADMQPSLTTMLRVNTDEEDILQSMKQKTRYNIRLSAKKGVEIELATDTASAMQEMYTLIEATSKRHGIGNHSRQYYMKMVETLGSVGMIEIVKATYQSETLAMNMLIHYGDTTTYLHGASSDNKKHLMAPYALQWAGILRAKEKGSVWYDFYGIGPENDPAHKLAGVTRFKNGFGGEEHAYAGTCELSISGFWYTMYRIVKKIRS